MISVLAVANRKVALLAGVMALSLFLPGCPCPSSNPDVTPDCPGGTRSASAITVNADFSSIRPVGQTIQLKIRGNRLSTDLCFQPGAQTSFLVPKLEGTTSATQSVPNLADGSWSIEIQALSGGNQTPVTLTKTLNPGATHILSISGNSAGDLTAVFP
jgi:hypothetical protein